MIILEKENEWMVRVWEQQLQSESWKKHKRSVFNKQRIIFHRKGCAVEEMAIRSVQRMVL